MEHEEYILKEYRPTQFERALESVRIPPSFPMLPLIHCADGVRHSHRDIPTAEDILRSGRIEPVPCDVFSENLVYTYIGRPAYRELTRPFCFIIKPLPALLQNLFVFDTGAYHDERYRKLVDSFQDIHLFRIPAEEEAVKRFIVNYFGNNERYFLSKALRSDAYSLENSLEEYSYVLFGSLSSFGRLGFDDRCRTLENIIRCPIELEQALQGIILPVSWQRSGGHGAEAGKLLQSVDVRTYDDTGESASPAECQAAMNQALYAYYQEKEYFI